MFKSIFYEEPDELDRHYTGLFIDVFTVSLKSVIALRNDCIQLLKIVTNFWEIADCRNILDCRSILCILTQDRLIPNLGLVTVHSVVDYPFIIFSQVFKLLFSPSNWLFFFFKVCLRPLSIHNQVPVNHPCQKHQDERLFAKKSALFANQVLSFKQMQHSEDKPPDNHFVTIHHVVTDEFSQLALVVALLILEVYSDLFVKLCMSQVQYCLSVFLCF